MPFNPNNMKSSVPKAIVTPRTDTAFAPTKQKQIQLDQRLNNETAYQQNLSSIRVVTPQQWDTRSLLGNIYALNQTDPDKAANLYSQFLQLQSDPTSKYYNPYTKATNKSVNNLAMFGIDTSKIDDDWYAQNDYLRQYLIYDGTTNTPSKPGKNASLEQMAAYEYYQVWKSEDATRKAEEQWQALQEELTGWVNLPGRNYTDDEILSKIDWSKYGELVNMDKNKAYQPNEYNRSIGYSKDALYGVLWAARNQNEDGLYGTGNLYADMAYSFLGMGSGYTENPEIRAKLNIDNKATYSPYELGSTMEDMMLYFNASSFNQRWLDTNRNMLNSEDATQVRNYKRVLAAEEYTQKLESQLDAMNAQIDKMLAKETYDADRIIKSVFGNSDYKDLMALDDTITGSNRGILKDTTRAINYKRQNIEQMIRDKCARKDAEKNGYFNNSYPEGSRDSAKNHSTNISNAGDAISAYGTGAEQAAAGSGASGQDIKTAMDYSQQTIGERSGDIMWDAEVAKYNQFYAQQREDYINNGDFTAMNYADLNEAEMIWQQKHDDAKEENDYQMQQAAELHKEEYIEAVRRLSYWSRPELYNDEDSAEQIATGLDGSLLAWVHGQYDKHYHSKEEWLNKDNLREFYDVINGQGAYDRDERDLRETPGDYLNTNVGEDRLEEFNRLHNPKANGIPWQDSELSVSDYFMYSPLDVYIWDQMERVVFADSAYSRTDLQVSEQKLKEIKKAKEDRLVQDRFESAIPKDADVSYHAPEIAAGFEGEAAAAIQMTTRNPESKGEIYNEKNADEVYSSANTLAGTGETKASFMTPRQTATFNYYYNSGQKDAAWEYYESLSAYLNKQVTQEKISQAQELANAPFWGPLAGVATVIDSIFDLPNEIIGAVGAATGNEDYQDPNHPIWQNKQTFNAIQAARADSWDWQLQNWFGEDAAGIGRFLSNTAYSVMQNVAVMGISGGLAGGAEAVSVGMVQLIMSSQAATSTMLECLQNNMDPTEAAIRAITTGAIEALTEKVSLEALLNPEANEFMRNWLDAAMYFGKNALAEASEEGASFVLEKVMDSLMSGVYDHPDEFTQKVYDEKNRLINEEGLSPEEAEKRAYKTAMEEEFNEMVQSVGSGALSGFVLSGGRAAINGVKTARSNKSVASLGGSIKKAGQDYVNGLIELGIKTGYGDDAYWAARNVSSESSDFNVGNLANVLLTSGDENVRNQAREILGMNQEQADQKTAEIQAEDANIRAREEAEKAKTEAPGTETQQTGTQQENAEPVKVNWREDQQTKDFITLLEATSDETNSGTAVTGIASVLDGSSEKSGVGTDAAIAAAQKLIGETAESPNQAASAISDMLESDKENYNQTKSDIAWAAMTKGKANAVLTEIMAKAGKVQITAEDVRNLRAAAESDQTGEQGDTLKENYAKTVLDSRIANKVMDHVANGELDQATSHEKGLVESAEMGVQTAQETARRAAADAEAAAKNVLAAEAEYNPSKDRQETAATLEQAANRVAGTVNQMRQAEQALEEAQEKKRRADKQLEEKTKEVMNQLRATAAAEIQQEDLQRAEIAAQQAEQTRIEAEQAEAARLDAQEASNFSRAEADQIIADNYANASEEDKNRIRGIVNKINSENPMTETDRVLARKDYVKRIAKKYGYEIEIGDTTRGGRFLYQNASVNPETGHIILSEQATVSDAMYAMLIHEVTHIAEKSELYDELADSLLKLKYGDNVDMMNADIAAKQDLYVKGLTELRRQGADVNPDNVDSNYAKQELVADLMGELFLDGNGNANVELLNRFVEESPSVARRVLDAIKSFLKKMVGIESAPLTEAQRIVDTLEAALKEANNKQGADTQKYQLVGTDPETGKKIYMSNFNNGTGAVDKGKHIIKLLQNVWSKNPISLTMIEEDGTERQIQAVFNPEFDQRQANKKLYGNEYTKTDAGKIAFGNQNGSRSEQRIALNLGDDYYELLQDSHFNDSAKNKEGEHEGEGINRWLYYVNDIYYAEKNADVADPYRVQIDIKETDDGDFVYSYWATKQEGQQKKLSLMDVMPVNTDDVDESAQPSEQIISPADSSVKTLVTNSDGEETAVQFQDGTVSIDPTRFSLSSFNSDERKAVRDALVKSGRFTNAQVNRYLDNATGIAAIIAADKARLDFDVTDKDKSMVKSNSDYGASIDASTLCAKRLVYQGTFDAIQHLLPNTPLMPEDLIHLSDMMREMGYETPCGICYVESRRRNLDKYIDEWLKTYKGNEKDGYYIPEIADVSTTDGLEVVRKNYPNTYKDFMDAMNSHGKQNNPKPVQLRTEYKGEIRALSDRSREKFINHGGIRLQSFSDFETPHLLDMVQVVMDIASKGLTSQAYTKVPNFAWVFGDTGIKINLSLIGKGEGVDANGNLIFDDVEGMPFEEAMKLRDRYSKNVGTILVGINDRQILAAMADPRIDYIIPFHSSGWTKEDMRLMPTLEKYTDYQNYQTEKDLDTGAKTKKNGGNNIAPVGAKDEYGNGYWDFEKSGKENAQTYLDLCYKNGLIPVFSQFLDRDSDGHYHLKEDGSTDGYWKLLIDFKMYENGGDGSNGVVKGAPQMAVTPDINMDQATRVLNEYDLTREQPGKDTAPAVMKDNNSLPVAQPVVERFVEEYKANHPLGEDRIKYSLPEDAPYMAAVERGEMEEAQRYVDRVARANGYKLTAHHGTGENFNIFRRGWEGIHLGNIDQAEQVASDRYENRSKTTDYRWGDIQDSIDRMNTDQRESLVKSAYFLLDYVENGQNIAPFSGDLSNTEEIRAYVDNIVNMYAEESSKMDGFPTPAEDINLRVNTFDRDVGRKVMKLYAKINNPFMINGDISFWTPWNIADVILKRADGITTSNVHGEAVNIDGTDVTLTDEQRATLSEMANNNTVVTDDQWDTLSDVLGELGFDGIQYLNTYEGDKNSYSYIALKQSDVKLADPVTYDDQGNVIPLSERFNDQKDDIRFSLPSDKILEQQIRYYMQNGKTSLPLEGENPMATSATGPAQRAFGQGMLQDSDEIDSRAKALVLAQNGRGIDTNAEQLDRAIRWIRSNKQTPNSDGLYEALQKIASNEFDYRSADGQARMVAAMGIAAAKNDTMAQTVLADAFNRQGTDLGRALQARKLFRLMTPEGRISSLEKMLQNTQDELNAKGTNIDLKFSTWIYQAAAAATEEGDFRKVQDAAAQELAEQLPANWRDKLRSFRMLSMLGNPRTHIRNIVGNAFFVPVVGLKNKLGAVAELGVKKGDKTKTLAPFLSREVRRFAKEDALAMRDVLTGEAKYNEESAVQRAQKPFKGLLQALIDFNSKKLEDEDWRFLKGHYKRALGGWMMANGYTEAQLRENPKLLEKGRTYATEEAQKATYRDFSKLAQTLNRVSREGGVGGFIVDAVLPFKKTPANILKRGMEYSPAGIMRSLTADLYHLKQWNDYNNGKLKAIPEKALSPTQFIDRLCSGLAGTAIMAVGALLSSAGIVSVGLDDDEDKLEKEKGGQEYALKFSIGGQDFTFTMDWAAPVSMPFFVGAAIQEQLSNQEGFDPEALVNAFGNISEPVFNLSMLDGVNTLFKTSQYDDTNTLTQIAAKVGSNYVTSYVPSLVGAVSRTIDDHRRKAYVESGKGTGVLGTFRYAAEQTENKIPGLSQTNIPYRDIWGNAETSSLAERIFENFILPGYISEYRDDPILNEMGRLYDVTGDSSMIPADPAKSVTYKKQKYVLTAEQWDRYKEVRGQTAFEILSDLVGSESYKNAGASVQTQMIKDAWSYADSVGKSTFIPDYEVPKMGNDPVQKIAKDATISGYEDEMIKALDAGDWDAYDAMVEALHQEEVEDSSIKTKIGNTYRDAWKNAYRKNDEAKMSEIEDIIEISGFDINIYGKGGWMNQVYKEDED